MKLKKKNSSNIRREEMVNTRHNTNYNNIDEAQDNKLFRSKEAKPAIINKNNDDIYNKEAG